MNIYLINAKEESSKVTSKKANIVIIDVSGSMYYELNTVATDISKQIETIPSGDAMIIGIFSSPGWFRWIAIREINTKADRDFILNAVKTELYTRGATCFSEILADTTNAIKPLLGTYSEFTLTFMSDGCTNAFPVDVEMVLIFNALGELRPYINGGSIISYGNYADRSLLSKMASALGVRFVTTNNIQTANAEFNLWNKDLITTKDVEISNVDADGVSFLYDGRDVTVVNGVKTDTTTTYKVPANQDLLHLQANDGSDLWSINASEDMYYAGTLAYVLKGDLEAAVTFISEHMGDVYVVDLIYNARTNADISNIEQVLRNAIVDPDQRLLKGQVLNYKPRADAFDIIDFFNLAIADPANCFDPFHSAFNYTRIGRPSKRKPGYPNFSVSEQLPQPINKMIGSNTELNLSMLVRLTGTITLPDSITDENGVVHTYDPSLPREYPTFIYRTFSLIANGFTNIKQLPMYLSKELHSALVRERILTRENKQYDPAKLYIVDLSQIPACARQKSKDSSNLTELCDRVSASADLALKLKTLNILLNDLDPNKTRKETTDLTETQLNYLLACGVTQDGAYNPPSESGETTDVMKITELTVKRAKGSGVSTLPTTNDFKAMLAGTKKINANGQLMLDYWHTLNGLSNNKLELILKVTELEQTLKAQKRVIDLEIALSKYALVVGGAWVSLPKTEGTDSIATVSSTGEAYVVTCKEKEKAI